MIHFWIDNKTLSNYCTEMSHTLLKKWMRDNHKTKIDIASITGLALNTVSRYLEGKPIRRANEAHILELVSKPESSRSKARK